MREGECLCSCVSTCNVLIGAVLQWSGHVDAVRMGNSSSDRASGSQGERSYRDGQQGAKEARSNILMDSTEDGDIFQREDAKEVLKLCLYQSDLYSFKKTQHFVSKSKNLFTNSKCFDIVVFSGSTGDTGVSGLATRQRE